MSQNSRQMVPRFLAKSGRERFLLAVRGWESEFQAISMTRYLTRLKDAILHIVRYVLTAVDRVIPFYFMSVLIGCVIAQSNEMGLFAQAMALMVGTALLVRCVIYLVTKPRVCKPLRDFISWRFASWPPVLGFMVLLSLVITTILVEVIILRSFVSPADSWLVVTAGFFYGVVATVVTAKDRRLVPRGEASVSNDLQSPTWIKYDPPSAQRGFISASGETVGK